MMPKTCENNFYFVCSVAEDEVIFPAVDAEISFVHEHAEEEIQFEKLRCLLDGIQNAEANLSSSEFWMSLSSHADQITSDVVRHFQSEEAQVRSLLIKLFFGQTI